MLCGIVRPLADADRKPSCYDGCVPYVLKVYTVVRDISLFS